jgi:hypothetical protein
VPCGESTKKDGDAGQLLALTCDDEDKIYRLKLIPMPAPWRLPGLPHSLDRNVLLDAEKLSMRLNQACPKSVSRALRRGVAAERAVRLLRAGSKQ